MNYNNYGLLEMFISPIVQVSQFDKAGKVRKKSHLEKRIKEPEGRLLNELNIVKIK